MPANDLYVMWFTVNGSKLMYQIMLFARLGNKY